MSKVLTFTLFLCTTSLYSQPVYHLNHDSYMRILNGQEEGLVANYQVANGQLVSQIDGFEVPLIVLLAGPEKLNQTSEELFFGNEYERCTFKLNRLDPAKQVLIGSLKCKGSVDSQALLDNLKK
jgi:hypothetical protein